MIYPRSSLVQPSVQALHSPMTYQLGRTGEPGVAPSEGLDPEVHFRVYDSPMATRSLARSATIPEAQATEATPKPIRIGELAKRTGVTVETIRYYEKRGLVGRSTRLASGYREFSPDAVNQILFIGRAQALGFSLSEVEELAALRRQAWAGDATAQLRTAAVAKLHDIDNRVHELGELRSELARLIAACDSACPVDTTDSAGASQNGTSRIDPADCPLVDALDTDTATRSRRRSRRAPASPDVDDSSATLKPSIRRPPIPARVTPSITRRKS